MSPADPHGALLPDADSTDVDGCEVSPEAFGCLACPLPECKFDNPSWYTSYRKEGRYVEMRHASEVEHMTVAMVATRFRVSLRTVGRALASVTA